MSLKAKRVVILLSGLFAIWIIYAVNAVTYGILSLYHTVNILYPFQTLVIVGLVFTGIYSVVGVLSKEKNWVTLVDILLLVLSIISSVLAVPSIIVMHLDVQLSFDVSVAIGCTVGIVIGFIGLTRVTYLALKPE
jgi:hypothetical protein